MGKMNKNIGIVLIIIGVLLLSFPVYGFFTQQSIIVVDEENIALDSDIDIKVSINVPSTVPETCGDTNKGTMRIFFKRQLPGSNTFFWFDLDTLYSPGGVSQATLNDFPLSSQQFSYFGQDMPGFTTGKWDVFSGMLCIVDNSVRYTLGPINLGRPDYTLDITESQVCAQVITPAEKDDDCVEYDNSCVPDGWVVVDSCPDPEVCGNDVCGEGEDKFNCELDCGTPTCEEAGTPLDEELPCTQATAYDYPLCDYDLSDCSECESDTTLVCNDGSEITTQFCVNGFLGVETNEVCPELECTEDNDCGTGYGCQENNCVEEQVEVTEPKDDIPTLPLIGGIIFLVSGFVMVRD